MEKKNEELRGKELVETITEKITLNIFKTGCDKVNFEIIKSLPSSVKDLYERTELSKMPLNRRLNELEKVGLLERERYEGEIQSTVLTKEFLKLINDLKIEIVKVLPDLI